jgi:UbiD family decarboxylase
MYRTQVFDERTVALNARPTKGINVNRAASGLGQDGFPVAIVLGLDPVIHMTTVANLPHGVSELAAAGALRGAPVELVPCVSQPLEVPASAEIVLEGVVTTDTRKEGPFGEYHGYYGAGGMRSVIRLTAITCRHDAINQQVYEGRPPQEDAVMHGTVVACEILRRIDLAGVRAVNVTPHSGGHLHCVISVDSDLAEDGLAVARAVLAVRGVKLVTVVDADVDVFDAGEVEWAVATRVDYSRDVEIIKAQADPAVTNGEPLRELLRGSKMIVDATRPRGRGFPLEARPPDDVIERVRDNWSAYGIS